MTSRECGQIGGKMVKKMVAFSEVVRPSFEQGLVQAFFPHTSTNKLTMISVLIKRFKNYNNTAIQKRYIPIKRQHAAYYNLAACCVKFRGVRVQ